MIDVVQKRIQRLHALLDTERQPAPFLAGDDAGHDVEGDEALGGLLLAINGEGDAGFAEDALGILHLLGQSGRVLFFQPTIISRVWSSQPGSFRKHLIESCQSRTPL